MENKHEFEIPPIESIFNLDSLLVDYKDELINEHGGINDIWHRMWVALSFEYQFPEMKDKSLRTSYMIRKELESALGISISDEECDQLRIQAINHVKKIINKR